jgi:hypothetical protein
MLPGWQGTVNAIYRQCDVEIQSADGSRSPATLTLTYVPSTRCYAFWEGLGANFVFRDRIAAISMKNGCSFFAVGWTNKVPEGEDADAWLERKKQEYLVAWPATPPGSFSSVRYLGHYFGMGDITRDPQTGAIHNVNYGLPDLNSYAMKGDGTNAVISFYPNGESVIDVTISPELIPIEARRGGKLVVVNATNNLCLAEKTWGPINEGFRLALTFPKITFTNAEPIIGMVTLQNVTSNDLSYTFTIPASQEIVVANHRGERLEVKEAMRPKTALEAASRSVVIDPKSRYVPPGGEHVFPVGVTAQYDLPGPASYEVFFRLTVPNRTDPKRDADVVSATMPVRVLGP